MYQVEFQKMRLAAYKKMLKIITENPIKGTGPKTLAKYNEATGANLRRGEDILGNLKLSFFFDTPKNKHGYSKREFEDIRYSLDGPDDLQTNIINSLEKSIKALSNQYEKAKKTVRNEKSIKRDMQKISDLIEKLGYQNFDSKITKEYADDLNGQSYHLRNIFD